MKRIILIVLSLLIFSASTLKAQTVDYYLPYPGVLPDHPFYWAKMVRDRIDLWLAFKPEKKAQVLLTYADKRLGAGWALVDKGEVDLGISTLTKGEKYLDEAEGLSEYLDENRLDKAKTKHWQVLAIIKNKVEDKHHPVIDTMMERLSPTAAKEITVTAVIDFGGLSNNLTATVSAATPMAALQQLTQQQGLTIQVKQYDFGAMVEGINGVISNATRAWIYFVNDQPGQVASDKHQLTAGDTIEWRYVKPQ